MILNHQKLKLSQHGEDAVCLYKVSTDLPWNTTGCPLWTASTKYLACPKQFVAKVLAYLNNPDDYEGVYAVINDVTLPIDLTQDIPFGVELVFKKKEPEVPMMPIGSFGMWKGKLVQLIQCPTSKTVVLTDVEAGLLAATFKRAEVTDGAIPSDTFGEVVEPAQVHVNVATANPPKKDSNHEDAIDAVLGAIIDNLVAKVK